MQKKEKILTAILAILLVVFALVALYFNVLMPRGGKEGASIYKPGQKEKAIQLNNTLKTSVTVLPAEGNGAQK